MSLNVYELHDSRPISRSVDSATATTKWIAFYSDVYNDVYAAILAVAPVTFSGYKRQKVSCTPHGTGGAGIWMCEVEYGFSANTQTDSPDAPTTPDDTTAMGPELTFDITAQQVHITQSLKTRFRYKAADVAVQGVNLTMHPTNNLRCKPAAPDAYTPAGGDVGKFLMIADDPLGAWNAGNYTITAVTGGYWVLNVSPAPVGSTGGRWGFVSSLTNVGTAANYKQAIGATKDRIEGTDIFVPHFEWTFTVQVNPLYQPYLRLIKALAGKTNALPWRGYAAGEVLYLGATGQCGPELTWKITHKFACGSNLYAIAVSDDIIIPFKGAWEYLWCVYGPSTDASKIVQVPQSAYVEQVYSQADMTLLGIGG